MYFNSGFSGVIVTTIDGGRSFSRFVGWLVLKTTAGEVREGEIIRTC